MHSRIDGLRILPKNKLLLYHCYILSKLSWYLTVAVLPKTQVVEHLDNLVMKLIRRWLDLPISTTLIGIYVFLCIKFGLNLKLHSVESQQCQAFVCTALKSSSNEVIKSLWRGSSVGMNIQYHTYQNTKQVGKIVKQDQIYKLQKQLTSQGFIVNNFITVHYKIIKLTTIIFRTTHHILCTCNKKWTNLTFSYSNTTNHKPTNKFSTSSRLLL